MYNFDFFNTFDFNLANIYNDKLDTTYLVYLDEDLKLHIKPIGSEMYKNIIVVYLGNEKCATTKYNILKSVILRLSDSGTGEDARDISLTEFRSTMFINNKGKMCLKKSMMERYQVDGISTLITTPELVFMNLYDLNNLNNVVIKCINSKDKTHFDLIELRGFSILELHGNYFKAYYDYLKIERKLDIPEILFERSLNNYLPDINFNERIIPGEYILEYSETKGFYFESYETQVYTEGATNLFK